MIRASLGLSSSDTTNCTALLNQGKIKITSALVIPETWHITLVSSNHLSGMHLMIFVGDWVIETNDHTLLQLSFPSSLLNYKYQRPETSRLHLPNIKNLRPTRGTP